VSAPTTADVDALLPQTQCTRCGYPDCAAYARAIAHDRAPINRCPPGGDATIAALAQLTGRAAAPLDPACGTEAPLLVAVVDEARCIGCTICIQVCPVDAIVGAPKRMHAVLDAWCSGCELCIAPCPVDCIVMRPAMRPWTDDDVACRASATARATRGSRAASASPTAAPRRRRSTASARAASRPSPPRSSARKRGARRRPREGRSFALALARRRRPRTR
jgi:electron transport complex protein RnfB